MAAFATDSSYTMTPFFAAGFVFSTTVFDNLVVLSYFARGVLRFTESMLGLDPNVKAPVTVRGWQGPRGPARTRSRARTHALLALWRDKKSHTHAGHISIIPTLRGAPPPTPTNCSARAAANAARPTATPPPP